MSSLMHISVRNAAQQGQLVTVQKSKSPKSEPRNKLLEVQVPSTEVPSLKQ